MFTKIQNAIFKYRVKKSLKLVEDTLAQNDRALFLSRSIDHQMVLYKKFASELIIVKFPHSKVLINWLTKNDVIFLKPRTPGLLYKTIGLYAKACSDGRRRCIVIDLESPKLDKEEFLIHIAREAIHLAGAQLKRFEHLPIEKDGDPFILENSIASMGGRWLYERIFKKNSSIFDFNKMIVSIIGASPDSELTVEDLKKAQKQAIESMNLILAR